MGEAQVLHSTPCRLYSKVSQPATTIPSESRYCLPQAGGKTATATCASGVVGMHYSRLLGARIPIFLVLPDAFGFWPA